MGPSLISCCEKGTLVVVNTWYKTFQVYIVHAIPLISFWSSIPHRTSYSLLSSEITIYPTHFQQQTMRSSSSFGLASAVVAISLLASTAVVNAACSTRSNVITTFYGYPDNDPPGPATAYNCGGRNNIAGGEYISSLLLLLPLWITLFFSHQRPQKRKCWMDFSIFLKNRYWNLRQPSYICQCSWRVHPLRNHILSLFEKISPFRGFLRSV